MNKIKILFIKNLNSPFIEKDLAMLRKSFDVKAIQLSLGNNFLINFINTIRYVFNCDITFTWFASYHAFIAVLLSKILKKKSIVVVGGYEVAKIPEINYGLLLNPIIALFIKFIFINADRILVVDESLKKDAIVNLHIPGTNIDTIPTGYDSEKYKPYGEKENLIITVGLITKTVMKRKGFDFFIQTASYFPDITFMLIGAPLDDSIDSLRQNATPNVVFPGFISEDKLIEYYQKAKIYCQFSLYEGLPNALCEAMLCECVPIGTKNCGIPTAIGDTGLYISYGNIPQTVEAVTKAIASCNGKKARERIKELFTSQRRECELIRIIKDLGEVERI